MLQIFLIGMIRHDGETKQTASCILQFDNTSVGVSMWEEDFKALKAAGLFGKGHKYNKNGHINETPVFITPIAVADEDLVQEQGEAFFSGAD